MQRFRIQFIAGLTLFILPVLFSRSFWSSPGFSVLYAGWFLLAGYILFCYFIKPVGRLESSLPESSAFFAYKDLIQDVSTRLENLRTKVRRETKERENMVSILFTMVEGVIATDSSGRISFINPAAEKLFDLERGEALRKFPREIWREFELVELFHQVFVTGNPQIREMKLDPPLKKCLNL